MTNTLIKKSYQFCGITRNKAEVAIDATRILKEIEGQHVISDRTTQNWYKKFRKGQSDLQEKRCSRKPSVVDQEIDCRRIHIYVEKTWTN